MSADPVKALASFKEKYRLNFPLLSDPTHKTIQKLGKTGKIEELWPIVRAKGHASEVLKVISKKQPAARVATA